MGTRMRPRLNQRIQFSLAYVLVAAMVLLLLQSWLQAPRTVEIPMSKFLELVRTDKIEKVALTQKQIRGIAKPEALPTPPSGPGDRLRRRRRRGQGAARRDRRLPEEPEEIPAPRRPHPEGRPAGVPSRHG